MAIGIDEIDDFDYEEQESNNSYSESHYDYQNDSQENNYNSDSETEDFTTDFLRSKGISDPSRIKFENEQGQIEERDWDSLSREEQINILNTPTGQQEADIEDRYGLADQEIALLNNMRQSGMTPQDYLTAVQQQAINSYVDQNSVPAYKVDDLSDDELYILDLESRVGELSDAQIEQALNTAKFDEDLYKKQVDGIRNEYKQREDYEEMQAQADYEQQQQEAFMNYQNNVVNAIQGFDRLGNLDINMEDADKEELAAFMLGQDQNGMNYFYKAIQDPNQAIRAAWFMLNGEEAINNISDYFINEIKRVSEARYYQGLADGQKENSSNVVIQRQPSAGHNSYRQPIKSIEDLD